jgi:hypothetical protein
MLFSGGGNPDEGSNRYGAPSLFTYNDTQTNIQIPLSAGTVSKLQVKTTTAPGSGNSWFVTVNKNGASSGITCTINGAATTCSDLVHTSTFVAGDLFSIVVDPDSNPTATGSITWSVVFQ